jgi:hypothetical protein
MMIVVDVNRIVLVFVPASFNINIKINSWSILGWSFTYIFVFLFLDKI